MERRPKLRDNKTVYSSKGMQSEPCSLKAQRFSGVSLRRIFFMTAVPAASTPGCRRYRWRMSWQGVALAKGQHAGVVCSPAEAVSLWPGGFSCCAAAERSASELLSAAYSSLSPRAKANSRRRISCPKEKKFKMLQPDHKFAPTDRDGLYPVVQQIYAASWFAEADW